MGVGNIKAVFEFEWKRSLTLPRMAWWGVLAGFPIFIVALLRISAEGSPPREMWVFVLFALVPMLVGTLGTLLWAAPAVSGELERRSWVYLAIRPHGSTAVLFGKYLAAVTWAASAALVGLTVAVMLSPIEESFRVWATMAGLVCLSCPAYGAVYLLLGTLFIKRSMVFSVAYTLVFELIISFVPAVINKMTVQYRLRALLIDWAKVDVPGRQDFTAIALLGDSPPWVHVVTLLGYILVLLLFAFALVQWREFAATQDTE